MTRALNESVVALDKLPGHLKALLRLKIREFVHLSPFFQNIPMVDPAVKTAPVLVRQVFPHHGRRAACPHRKHDGKTGRRIVRGSLHLNGVIR